MLQATTYGFPVLVSLFMNIAFMPKVYTMTNAARPIYVSAVRSPTGGALLCKPSTGHSMSMCNTLATTGKTALPSFSSPMADELGKPISKQRLSNWLVECIKFTYKKRDHPVPDRVMGHQTCKMAVT